MDVLKATNEELFDFSDVTPDIEESLDAEEFSRHFAAEFPEALEYLLGDRNKTGKYWKLMEKFYQKFEYVNFDQMILGFAVMGLIESGWSPDDIIEEVVDTIDSHLGL